MSDRSLDDSPGAGPADLPGDLEDRAFEVLLDLPPAAREPAFEALLDAHPEARDALLALRRKLGGAETALTGAGLAEAPGPERVGAYQLLARLGEGGFGVVWLAEQREPLRRQVAVKLIRPGMDSEAVLRRFQAEREVLARFDHPCVARILDAGQLGDGRPFLVTEYVPGEPITVFCDRRRLALRARLALFLRVCDGVQHAHQRGVIHRDLKPSNVLVFDLDGEPWPKVIDFGIARALTGDDVGMTRAGSLLGTPEYMSPEQAEASVDVDTRTDVYSLGVLLFELLVGDMPQPRSRWRDAGLSELIELIRNAEAPRPSTRTSDSAMARALRGDLDWIVLTAVAKDRDRRYRTVAELAADLDNYLANRPVRARPPSFFYALRKFAVRHRIEVAAGAVVFVTLVVALVVALRAYEDARRAATEAASAAVDAREHLDNYQRLAAVLRLAELSDEASALWPAPADRVTVYDRWLAAATALIDDRAAAENDVRLASSRLAAAGNVAGASADRFLAETLTRYLRDLDEFAGPNGTLDDVRRRRDWAAVVRARSIDEHTERWEQAIAAIRASPYYGGRRIAPQLGLVPLGPDPVTGFEEFVHVQSGAIPHRGADGRLELGEEHGIVLVLLPGGTVSMGAQNIDPARPNYDRVLTPGQGDVQRIRLDPFFVAKHEISRAQWRRAIGQDPSYLRLDDRPNAEITLRHPVENLSWQMAADAARRLDLALPTEAQWEYACRAGTATPYYTGQTESTLQGHENLAGREAAAVAAQGIAVSQSFEDDYRLTAAVGSMRPNDFGLYDIAGNVAEWCADRAMPMSVPARDGDGLRDDPANPEEHRIVRGASYRDSPLRAKSALRGSLRFDVRNPFAGLRPTRPVTSDPYRE
ncbi:MAG: SUMF1/EgtB/PvdO family nonheme iron enzyme [Planctomycetes bacterium]|nr:SUMF1/EgtB/PvdO family nonheme iron enzyme [Planctomycetota bacterium]